MTANLDLLGASPTQDSLLLLLDQYKSLVIKDSAYLLPVITSLSTLPLDKKQRREILDMAREGIV